jgi:probable HAF family extracellular repeat protein
VITDLGTLGGTYSYAYALNTDGQVVVGYAYTAGDAAVHAVRWDGAAITDLGTLGGTDSLAYAVSSNGQVVVGESLITGNSAYHAFRWTPATGTQDLNTLLANAGVTMTGITLYNAVAISSNGQFITGTGTFDGGATNHAYWVRYDDGAGGLTTTGSLQQSVNDLSNDRFGMMAQQHGLANPLLGGDKPMTNDSEVGVFGMGGSAAGGGYARYGTGGGLAILAGVSYGEEAYQDASIEDSLMGALAVRYLAPGAALWRPFAEVGGWIAPEADLEFERTYMNGAGTATGLGNTEGDVSYYYARAGMVFDLGNREQVVVSGEIGRERLEVDGYSETLAGNPFNAQVSSGTDEMDLAKARLAWSFALAPRVDATLWGAGVYGFNRESDLVTSVAGVGTFVPAASDDTAWAEYGARVGYAVTEAVTFDVFVNGVSGDDDIDTRVHGGAGLRYRF